MQSKSATPPISAAPPSVSVLGLGNWGTALANHLGRKGLPVLGWSNQAEIVSAINANHLNPSALKNISLSDNFRATSNIEDTFDSEFIVLAVPSKALSDVVPKLKISGAHTLVSVIKGMELATLLTPLQFIASKLPGEIKSCVLSGPSFADDVTAGKPCGVVAASKDESVARAVAELFSGDTMKVYVSTDPLGVELGGIVKNIIALAAGVSDGLGYGDSARAGLITRGLAEIVRFAEALGADRMTLFGLSGLGDLAMTASSDLSRNRTVGLRLGRGEKLPEILASLGSVSEGVHTAPIILQLSKRYGIEMPITERVVSLLEGHDTPATMAKALLSRPIKREFQ